MIISLLLGGHALAFAPSDDIYIGIEPQRIMRYHAERQYALRHGPGWQSFIAGAGQGWHARFDEKAGTVFRASGPGIPMGPIDSTAQAGRAVLDLLAEYPDLIQVPIEQLRFSKGGFDEQTGTWFVQLDRTIRPDVQGFVAEAPISVYRAGVQARIKNGNLIMLGLETHPNADQVDTTGTIAERAALQASIALGPAPAAAHRFESARKVVLPEVAGSGLSYRLTWEVRTRTDSPVGIWVSHIDAHTGELVNVYNEIRFIGGVIEGVHETRTLDGNFSTSVLPYVNITNSDGTAQNAEFDGTFNFDGGDFATVRLRGGGVNIVNASGDEGELVVGEGGGVFTDADATQAEITSFVFLQEILDWGEIYAPYVNDRWNNVRSNVNRTDGDCNAFFDGNSVNFYAANRGCNNTAQIADVNYHEWGHGFHAYSLVAGSFDGSISEGIADVVSALQTGDNIMAPYFNTNGSGIRNLEPNRRYPEDIIEQVHTDGLIFGGAMWDLWDELRDDYSEEDARDLTARLLAGGIRGGPTIPESYDEVVVADDDDGDLGNGTPNLCAIIDAFALHGLGPAGNTGSAVELATLPLGNQPISAAQYDIEADLIDLGAGCVEAGDADTAEVFYSIDDGQTWTSAPLSADSETLTGAIPQQVPGTTVLYYIKTTVDGENLTAPSGGEITPLSFMVGELIEIYCEDFEVSDGGYTNQLLAGEPGDGANDWQWGVPGGLAGDPDFAASGDRVWGTDLGQVINGQQWNGEYQPNKHTRLQSPEIELYNPLDEAYSGPYVVQFNRWLSVEDAYYDIARVTFNADEAWTNYSSPPEINPNNAETHHQDSQWAPQTLIYDGDSDALVIGWEIESDPGLHFGGWNVDDVCVYALDIPTDSNDDEDGNNGNNGNNGGGGGGDNVDGSGSGWSYGCASTGNGGAGGLLAGLLAAGLLVMRRRRDD
ncbi:MAG: MYXO-CTERM sorting domain-containing protein [Myxococcota bacterium]